MEYIDGCRIDEKDRISTIGSDGTSVQSTMKTLIDLFAAQIFSWGWVGLFTPYVKAVSISMIWLTFLFCFSRPLLGIDPL